MQNNNLMLPAMLQACSEQCPYPFLSSPTLSHNRYGAAGVKGQTAEAKNINVMLSCGKVEIRANAKGTWWSGIFDDYAPISKSARWAERKGFDVYTSLNPSDRPVTNQIRPYAKAVSDDNVTRIVRIPFDFDPERETGTAASDVQLGYARERARILIDTLAGMGWANPLVGMSGNGYHVQYLCDLPNDDHTKAMLADLYRGLGVRMSTAEVAFDVTVRNPSRIFRMYGTTNRKSGRRSTLELPDELSVVPVDVIAETAATVKPPKPKPAPAKVQRSKAKGYRWFDVVGLFQSLGLYKRPLGNGKHAVTCVCVERHSSPDALHKTDTVVWDGEWPQYHCSHAHCEGVTIHDVIADFA